MQAVFCFLKNFVCVSLEYVRGNLLAAVSRQTMAVLLSVGTEIKYKTDIIP